MEFDVAVVGAGPAGAAAAIWAQRAGLATILIDAKPAGRDKTCGDGLTPRAVSALRELGIEAPAYRTRGLKLHGFGGSVTAPWPDGPFGAQGSASPRALFDASLVAAARSAGTQVRHDCPATAVDVRGGAIARIDTPQGEIRPKWVIVADGVRSPLGKMLGRAWHRGEVYGIAARSYCTSPRADEPWLHSHLEMRDGAGAVQPGYGWIFPLGGSAGAVNLGCGALSTDARPAKVNTKALLRAYAAERREEWGLGPVTGLTSALLPMGGAVTNVAGRNWALIGDAAACVNPLNGEGIDYGLETARLAVDMIAAAPGGFDLTLAWPEMLRHTYGDAFALARTAARLLTYPRFLPAVGPLALRGPLGAKLMPAAARLMGNVVTESDRDLVSWAWRKAGRLTPKRETLWGVS
ncbi:geranylgeranyl reductase family protein [Corynebacterium liangguodongii]|uniref:FAD-linked oxidoreductase n=1 Tax=Corynebacterium liangguodongii TaxID=2079535 RepID=A0A2S0WC31_9CORY|nr:geranylgeranyl reductase family protein [Corynebacterium liangguodongii]AWB83331.1 FAD-linked oxidoreductase [Corynebacterium liangguodongii]PWC00579.1 geranylgeranyl reductase family protein [Corynebacterium liangguodongii]